MSTPSQHFSNGKALLRMRSTSCFLFTVVIIAATISTNSIVDGAPAKLDALAETPFNLQLQPPVFEASFSGDDGDTKKTLDSYGNPIESLKPIETPDGRKVVSAQGLQFEIPNYASGITELRKPSDDLLPPFVGEFSKDLQKPSNTTTEGHNNDGSRVKVDATTGGDVFVSTNIAGDADSNDLLRIERQQPIHNASNSNDNTGDVATTRNTQTLNTDTNPNKANETARFDHHQQPSTAASSQSYSAQNSQIIKSPSFQSSPSSTSVSPILSQSSTIYSTSTTSSKSQSQLSAHYTPLSNGNFNYPNVPTDVSIIERIASKYHNPLPTLDPIAVAVPNDSSESSFTTSSVASDVENVPFDGTGIFKGLPEYIVQLNDPDIGGPVEYMPTDDNNGLSIIAWDLLPPLNADPAVINAPSKQRVNAASTTSQSIYSHSSTATAGTNSLDDQQHLKTSQTTSSPFEFNTESATKYTRTQQSNRGNIHYSTSTTTPRSTSIKTTTTKRPTTTTTRKTTTTTLRTTTTPRTTTTRRTTTKAPTTTTTAQPDSSEFFKLEAGDSYTLPSWLADIDDPDLDVAVTYIVPDDVNEYNHTISRDLLPPLEPYTDLNVVNLTPPPGFENSKPAQATTTTTPKPTTTIRTTSTTTPRSTTSTTRRPTVASSQPHWVRAKVTSAPSVRPTSTFSNQFTSSSQTFNSPTTFTTTSAGNSNLAQRTTTTTTITVKPKTTTSPFNRPLSNTDKISSEENTQAGSQRPPNPFLNGSYKPQPFSKPSTTTTRRTTTSTTTTTTTTTRTPKVDANPFEPTIPPWLRDFDYADVGPGVPFVYDPNDDESPVDEDILPPSKTNAVEDATATKATSTFVNSPTTATSFLNSQNQQSFLTKFTSTATSLTSSPSIPSKVTLPLPSIELKQDDNSITQPPTVFVPPTPTPPGDDTNTSIKTSSSFNTNFPARFEPSPTPIATDNPNKVPLSADRESFPPFNTSPSTPGVSIPTKTTFSKSEDGKVITNNIFLNGGATQATTTKTYGSTILPNTQQKDTFGSSGSGFNKASTVSSSFNQFSTSSGASGFVTASSSAASSDGTKYTGHFGGPPGVLAPNSKPVGFATASTPSVAAQSFQKPSPLAPATTTGANKSNSAHKFTGSFGGPPGVLRPYDNVQSG